MSDVEVAVVGGGLAGAAAAIRLAREGVRTVLLERTAGPMPKVCGEFLSAVAIAELGGLGVNIADHGAVSLGTVRIAAAGDMACTTLPFAASSLTRARLDEALIERAHEAGVRVQRGVTVRAVTGSGAAWTVTTADRRVLTADRVVLASGKHDVAGRRRGRGLHNGLVGLKLYAQPSRAGRDLVGDAAELVLFPGGYCGIQPVEDGRINLCLVVEAARLKKAGRPRDFFEALRRRAPRLDALLEGGFLESRAPITVSGTPCGLVRRMTDGPYHVGDQAAVIPSFCGEGMAIALVSAGAAADAILAGTGAAAYQERFARRVVTRVKAATMFSRLVVHGAAQGPVVTAARTAPWLVRAAAASVRTRA